MKNKIYKIKGKILILFLAILSVSSIKAQCVANFTYTQGLNGSITFSNTSTPQGTTTVYQWNFGEPISGFNTSGALNPVHIYGSNGVYSATLTIVVGGTLGGCTSTIAQNVTVTSSPCNLPINASWSFVKSAGTVSFTSISTGTTGGASYAWDFGDGNTANSANTVHTYSTNNNFLPKLKISDGGCVDSLETLIGICLVVPSFTSVSGPNGAYSFSSTSTGTPGPTTYNWMFGDGNTSPGSVSTHTYNSNGNYNITLWLYNISYSTCITNTAQTIISISNATCNLNALMSSTVNPGGVVNFESVSTGTTGGVSYLWNYGDGTTGTGLTSSHTYSNGGNHSIWLKVNNTPTCVDSIQVTVNVNTIPCVANSNFSLTYSGTPLLWYATPSYPWNLTCANWNWGDGTTNTICAVYASHTYSAAGVYSICLNGTSACATSTTCSSNNIFKSPDPSMAMVTLSVVPLTQFITTIKKNLEENALVSVYPSPNDGKISLKIFGINGSKSVNVEVFDILGKSVYKENVNQTNGSIDHTFSLQHLANGSYYVKIKTTEKTYTAKTVISK